MNIISVKRLPGQDIYQLNENERIVLKLRYKQEMHIARVEAEKEQRVLIIEDEGLLRTKMSIKNEYGIGIGHLVFDNFSDSHGLVEIENTRFRFSIRHGASPELNIFSTSPKHLLYSCSFSFNEKNNYTSANDNKQPRYKVRSSSFIIAVSWYLFRKTVGSNELVNTA